MGRDTGHGRCHFDLWSISGGGGWGHWSSVGENCYMFVVIGTEIHNNGRQRVGPLVLSCVMIVPRQFFF